MKTSCLLAILFLVSFMFSTGLETARGDIFAATNNRRLILRAVLANLVLVPVLAMVVSEVFGLPSQLRVGVLLVAFVPGGFLALNFIKQAGGAIPFTIGLTFILNVLTMALIPFLVRWLHVETQFRFPALRFVALLLAFGFVPLLLGRWLRAATAATPKALLKPLNILSLLLFVAANVAALKARKSALSAVDAQTTFAMALLVAGAWGIGWGLAGPDLGTRKSIAITTSMRNVAIALMLCSGLPPESETVVAVIAFSAICVPMNLTFGFILHWIGKVPAGQVERTHA